MPLPWKYCLSVFLLLLPMVAGVELDCGPRGEAKENSDHNLTCSGLQPGQPVGWSKRRPNSGSFRPMALCDGTGFCQAISSSPYYVSRTDHMTSLTIHDVRRDDTEFVSGEWSCVAGVSSASCTVSVVFLPVIEKCEVGFDEENTRVVGRCEISKVFPEPTCVWFEQFEGKERKISTDHTSVNITDYLAENQTYHQATCHLHSPLPTKEGNYQYKLLIIPGHVEPRLTNTTATYVDRVTADQNKGDSLDTSIVVGSIVGVIVLIAAVAALAVWRIYRRKRRYRDEILLLTHMLKPNQSRERRALLGSRQDQSSGWTDTELGRDLDKDGLWGQHPTKARRHQHRLETEERWALLTGDVTRDWPSFDRTVRIFLSSTFTDTEEERNALLEDVSDELRAWCQEKGYQFQLVDMRWGIPDEATNDHRTLDLCLKEIKKCQALNRGPFFVTLVSHKYGYRPLPREIEATEFERLAAAVESTAARELLEKWYKRDDHAVPPAYVLLPVSHHYPDFLSADKETKKEAARKWWKEYKDMHAALVQASSCHELTQSEAQIRHGLLTNDGRFLECGFWFYRHIDNIDSVPSKPVGKRYKDCGGTEAQNAESRRLLEDQKTELRDRLSGDRVIQYNVSLDNEKGVSPELNETHRQYIKSFCSDFKRRVCGDIEKAITSCHDAEHATSLLVEVTQHIRFCQEKCRVFCGRQDTLQAVQKYLTSDSNCVHVIHGRSGSGKTSIVAMAAQEAWRLHKEQDKGAVIIRFLGITPDSTTVSSLLASIIRQLRALKNKYMTLSEVDIPLSVDDRTELFHSLLADTASTEFPVTLLLDSLDQLDPADGARQLKWLPKKLPPDVKLIVSTLPEEQYEILPNLQALYKGRQAIFYEVPSLDNSDVGNILDKWLAASERQLTPGQRSLVVKAFKNCPLPLFLKLSFDTACRWRSFWPVERTVLQDTVIKSINDLFDQLEKSHGRMFVSGALGYITVSRGGLMETELEDVLSCDDDVLDSVFTYWTLPVRRLPPLLLVRLKADLDQYLVDRGVDGVRVFYWYHRQFIEAAQARYCNDANTRQTLHASLADLFAGTWADGRPKVYTEKSGQTKQADRRVTPQPLTFGGKYNLRKLNNLPYHCCQPKQKDAVKEETLKQDMSKEGAVKEETLKQDLSKEDAVKKKTLKQDLSKEDAVKKKTLKQDLSKEDAVKHHMLKEDMSEKPMLMKAMLKEQCLLNLQFLQTKLRACGVRSVLDDFLAAKRAFPDDTDLTTVAEALQLSQVVLQSDLSQLPAQILGRITSPSQTLEPFLQQCRDCDIYLSASQQVLTPAGGQLIHTLDLGEGRISDLAITQDGQYVVTAGWSLCVVEVAEGRCVKRIDDVFSRRVDLCCDDRIIVARSIRQRLEAYKLHTGVLAWTKDETHDWRVWETEPAWCVCGEGRTVIATFSGRTVTLLDAETGEERYTIDVSDYVQTDFYGLTRSAGSKSFLTVCTGRHSRTVRREMAMAACKTLSPKLTHTHSRTVDLIVISIEDREVIAKRRLVGRKTQTENDDGGGGRHHQGDGGHHQGDSSEGNGGHHHGDGGHHNGDGEHHLSGGGPHKDDSSEDEREHDEEDEIFTEGELAISRDEKYVVFFRVNNSEQLDFRYLDIATLSAVGRDEVKATSLWRPRVSPCIQVTADGRYLYYGKNDTVHIWDLHTARMTSSPLHAWIGRAVTADGKTFVTTDCFEKMLLIFDVSRGPQKGQTTRRPFSTAAEGDKDDKVDDQNDDGDKDDSDVDGRASDRCVVEVWRLLALSTPRYVLMLTKQKVRDESEKKDEEKEKEEGEEEEKEEKEEKWDWFLQVYDLATEKTVRKAWIGRLSYHNVCEKMLFTEGTCILVQTNRRLKLVDVDKMAIIRSFQGRTCRTAPVFLVRKGGEMRAVTLTKGGHHVKVYEVATGRVLGTARQTGRAEKLYTLDGLLVDQQGTVAVADIRWLGKVLLVFDLSSYRHVHTVTAESLGKLLINLRCTAMTPDGRYLLLECRMKLRYASQLTEDRMCVYDLQERKIKNWLLDGPRGLRKLLKVALLDDRRLLYTGLDGCVRLFDIQTGAVLERVEVRVNNILTDPACPLVVTTADQVVARIIRVWRKDDMTPLCSLTLDKKVRDITLLPNYSVLARMEETRELVVFSLYGARKEELLGNQQPLSQYPETYQGTKLDLKINDWLEDVGTDDETDPDDDKESENDKNVCTLTEIDSEFLFF